MDPNSTHQLWSRWTFVFETKRNPSMTIVRENAARFFAQLFGSTVGRLRVMRVGNSVTKDVQWRLELEIEGPPAHDPDCRKSVERQFTEHFMKRGFGPTSRLVSMDACILAGDVQDGKPPSQLIVMPRVNLLTQEEEH